MSLEALAKDFPLLEKSVNGKQIIYFDNAATSLKPRPVLEAMRHYYEDCTANIHRGVHHLSGESSRLYGEAHSKVERLVNAKPGEIVFTRNATESMNLVMYSLLNSGYFRQGDEIVISGMEHHSNIVPWQFLERKHGIKLKIAKLTGNFEIDMADLQEKMSARTRLVSVTHASNTVATINPVREMGKVCHDANALFLVDAAQSVPHMPVDVKKINADFLAFSSHKMCGPTGVGALYAKKELLEKQEPFLFGGDMIFSVQEHSATWNKLPYKFEAGTPAIAEGIGFGEAADYIRKAGLENIRAHGKKLTKLAFEKLSGIKGIKFFNPLDAEKQGSIVLFDIPGMNCHDVALSLDETANVAIRSGMHCAEPLVSKFNRDGLARASFYFYNSNEEIEIFAQALRKIASAFG
ncbi:MAG: cysteine desulfurase [Candidatus Diapherotrites archaeon]|nr:cysteine desulfurase [Candidatus Diapherotrites archaeon]